LRIKNNLNEDFSLRNIKSLFSIWEIWDGLKIVGQCRSAPVRVCHEIYQSLTVRQLFQNVPNQFNDILATLLLLENRVLQFTGIKMAERIPAGKFRKETFVGLFLVGGIWTSDPLLPEEISSLLLSKMENGRARTEIKKLTVNKKF
jgi:hypothetical protein